MKHIKKVFLTGERPQVSNEILDTKLNLQNLKQIQQMMVMRESEGKHYVGLIHKDKVSKDNFIINVPIMPMVFYDSAYTSNLQLKQIRKELFKILNDENKDSAYNATTDHKVYRFIGYATSVIFLLCNSLECFANEMISTRDYKYERKTTRNTEIYNSFEIQQYIDINTKLTEILPKVMGVKLEKNSLFVQSVFRLVDFRNELTHLKIKESLIKERIDILRKCLNFDYDKSLMDVRKFINHFSPDYLKDCDCTENF